MALKKVPRALSDAFFDVLVSLEKGPKRYGEIKRKVSRTDKTVADVLKKANKFSLIEKKPVKQDQEVFALYLLTKSGNRFVREMKAWDSKL